MVKIRVKCHLWEGNLLCFFSVKSSAQFFVIMQILQIHTDYMCSISVVCSCCWAPQKCCILKECEEILTCSLFTCFLSFSRVHYHTRKQESCVFHWIALNCCIMSFCFCGLSCMQEKQDNNEEEKVGRKFCLAYIYVHVLCE